MYVHPDSQPRPVFAGRRGGCLIVLLCLSVLGAVLEYLAYESVQSWHGRGGDGFHEAPLFFAFGAFGPIQLVCVVMLVAAIRRANLPKIDV
jgi:uncharacterized membrane protein